MIDVELGYPFYPGLDGQPLQLGTIYYGVSGQNPVTSPVTVYWDAAGTQPAKQPIAVKNGLPTRNGAPARVYVSGDYSKLVQDSLGRQVLFEPLQSSRNLGTLSFLQSAAGAVSRTAQDKLSDQVSVKDFGAKGDGVTDDTAAVLAAVNSGAKRILWPRGKYLLTAAALAGATIQGGSAEWYGDGQGPSFTIPTLTDGTTIVCRGNNSGNAFIRAPQVMSGFHIDGEDKTGIGLDFGVEYFFDGFGNYKCITIRRFATGMRMFNLFNHHFESFVVESNTRGVTATPLQDNTQNGGDNGYFTTITWKDFYIRNNDVYGLLAFTPKGGKDWTWNNVLIEANGTVGGTYQASIQKLDLSIRGAYFEAAATVPALKINDSTVMIDVGFINGTGGFDFTNNNCKVDFTGLSTTSATDVFANISSGARMRLTHCTLRNDIRDLAGGMEIFNTSFVDSTNPAGTLVRKLVRSLAIGNSDTGTPAVLSHAKVFTKTVNGTVPAAGRLELMDRQTSFGLWNNASYGATTAIATIKCTDPARVSLIPYVCYGDTDSNFSVEVFNPTGAPITMVNAVLTVTFIRSDAVAL